MRLALVGLSLSGFALAFSAFALSGCSSLSKKQPVIYASGDKALIGSLTYAVIDTEILTQLGDNPGTARTPRNRFYLIKVSVSNSGAEDAPIPGMTLVADSGETYGEVANGAGVPDWLGIVRSVSGSQTDTGNILFDAPAGHYRLKLTDDLNEKEVFIDIPLTFEHQQMKNLAAPQEAPPEQIPIPRK